MAAWGSGVGMVVVLGGSMHQNPSLVSGPWPKIPSLEFAGILINYDMAICNLTPVVVRLITYYELLNQ